MKPNLRATVIPFITLVLVALVGVVAVQRIISNTIVANVQQEVPSASGISASIPLLDVPSTLLSDSINVARIDIERYILEGSEVAPSLSITASDISKSQPTVIGNLDVTATISAATLTSSSGFDSAKVVGNSLQVGIGSGGMGEALLTPKYENNEFYFELEQVSFLGNEISAASLPDSARDEVKARSRRTLAFPSALQVKSVSLGSAGLSFKMHGSNVELGSLRQEVEEKS